MKCSDLVFEQQVEIGTRPAEGMLVQPAGLTRFQQNGFSYFGQLRVADLSKQTWTPKQLIKHLQKHPDTCCQWDITARYHGRYNSTEEDRICPSCGGRMHIKGSTTTTIKHLALGLMKSEIVVERASCRCPFCGKAVNPSLPFQEPGHRITVSLANTVRSLCAWGMTQVEIERLTGVNRHVIKDLDKERLSGLYTENGKLRQPEKQARILGIDEFSLHRGHQYATLIMDIDTGHVLYLARGKKKDVVYKFIEHVGTEWMQGVQAVCCDMNADFAKAFQEKCPHLKVVFDRFHIVRNFNKKVLDEIRKDEQARLKAEGREEEAKRLKNCKYLICSNRTTLQKRDQQAADGVLKHKGSELFDVPAQKRRGGREESYDELINNNLLFFVADYVKVALESAYKSTDRAKMEREIKEIIEVCRLTENKHFAWFAKLLEDHLEGITSHADYPNSSGKVEGMNNKIKTIRRKSYGLPDTTYFFLKIMDASRRKTA